MIKWIPVPTAIPATIPQFRSALCRVSKPNTAVVKIFWIVVAVADINVIHPNRIKI